MRFKILLILLFCGCFGLQLNAKKSNHIICIEDATVALSDKEAIIILPGLGDGKKQRKCQQEFFCGQGFDVYIPDYINKESFDATYTEFSDFHKEYQLGSYKKLHVFAYILGTWTINSYIQKNGRGNIASIVYDRSPMQELAPALIVENIPRIAKFMFGKLPEDLSNMPYPAIDTAGVKIGLMVESKATAILRHYEEKAKLKSSFDWGNIDYQQEYDDLMYTYLNHDEMYTRMEVFGNYVLNFFKEGSFGIMARRNWYGWNSFEKLPKVKKTAVKKHPDFIGVWESNKFFLESIKDSAYMRIGADTNHPDSEYTDKSHSIIANTVIAGEAGEAGDVKINSGKTLLQFTENGKVLPIQQLPVRDTEGNWFFVLDGVKYSKVEPKRN